MTKTIFNGQLMSYARISEEEITIKLQGEEKAIVIEKDDELYGHYKAEYSMLADTLVEQRETKERAKAAKPKLTLTD